MSPLFLKQFKAYNRRKCCKEHPVNSYSLCSEHLVKARKEWQGFQETRRAMGRCCYCDRKNWKGMLRCKTHREINRKECREWVRLHPDRSFQVWKERQQKWLLLGKCCMCYEHNNLEPGFRRCKPCRTKNQECKRGESPTLEKAPHVVTDARGAKRPVLARPLRPYSDNW